MYLGGKGRQRLIRTTVVVAILALLLSVASSLLTALSADAHTALESVSPADGSTSQQAPTQVRLEFTDEVSASFATVTVTGVDGNEAGQGAAVVDGPVVTQALRGGLGSGEYAVAFRVVAADGHPITGTSSFTLDVAPVVQGGGSVTSEPGTDVTTDTATTSPSTPVGSAAGSTDPGTTPTGSATLVSSSGETVPDGSMPVLLAGGVLVLLALVLALLLARRRGSAEHTGVDD